jgi:hypothetical protein
MSGSADDGTTSRAEYASYILKAIKSLGGEAPRWRVIEEAYVLMDPLLLPGDRQILYGGQLSRWRSQAEQMLDGLVEEGYLEESEGAVRLTEKGHAIC